MHLPIAGFLTFILGPATSQRGHGQPRSISGKKCKSLQFRTHATSKYVSIFYIAPKCRQRISQDGEQRGLDLQRIFRYQRLMRKVICFLVLLLFVGHHGVSASNFSSPGFMNPDIEQTFDSGDQTFVRALQKCCGGDDLQNTSGRTAPCSSDCSFTTASFDLVFKSHQRVPAFEVQRSAIATFRHTLFRPPIA